MPAVTVLQETRGAVTDTLLVVADAARLLVRHLPALLTVFLLGLACRNGAMWAAVLLGRDHPILASLLVPLAPLAMVTALVVMLRIAGSSLVAPDADRSLSRQVAVLTSALVPFLTVYTLTGQLKADRDQFVNESYADEFQNGDPLAGGPLADRTLFTVDSWLIGLVVGVLVIRILIDVLDLVDRHPAWGLLQALVEVTWLTWFANFLTSQWEDARGWLGDRVLVGWAGDSWRNLTDRFGPLTDPLRWVGDLGADTFDRVGAIVVTPVAWLAVGAVVIAGGLPASSRARLHLPSRAQRLHERVVPGLELARRNRAGSKALELVGRRFEDLRDALRILVHAGVLPVLAFCLVLPLARLVEWGAALGLRSLVGPRDPDTMIYFSLYLDIVTRTAYTLVVVVVVVSAVGRLLIARPASAPEPEVAASVSAG